ncbi:alpha-L-fucosidase [Saccharomonospora piscinae]|uniref:Alpha-L-fucosidase n=1 Tax=Saccharomonospora piscinae TaxID=687388 RepID=A0A1V9A9W1_SACPI|nr:glycoside hydrolase N-terminal domain-containing protein [Saccharomonospora piscinae]OQO93915.1 alpha-L-fucosidase [Saccharomonospora piscinae]
MIGRSGRVRRARPPLRRTTAATAALAVVAGVVAAMPAVGTAQPADEAGTATSPDGRDGRDGLTLWYDEPASDWESEILPVGNGALGAGVFGGVETERLQFNEKTLWTGGPGSADGYDFGNWDAPRPGALEEVQQRIDEQRRADPEWVADKLGEPKQGYGAYQTFGEVALSAAEPPGDVSGYRRHLDIADATAGVTYVADGVRHTREYFASAPGEVIAGRLTADEPGAVDLTVGVTAPDNRSKSATAEDGRITFAGALDDNGLRYEAQIQVLAGGGAVTDNADGSVTVTGADALTLVLAAGTDYADTYPDYRGEDPHAAVTERVDAAVAAGYGALRSAHVADHRELFDRVGLDLGQRMPGQPTDELLAGYRDGDLPADHRRALEVLYFQYGRYLLIASSRPGSLPANLQGVWNDSTSPPWSADYHVNINLQMNYWPAEVTNLSETTEPLFDYVDSLVPPGEVTAREMFGNRGWVVHNETTPYGYTGVHDWATAFWFPEAGAWLAQSYYEHYRFTRDEQFLRERAYPMLKSLSRFWIDELVTDPRDGALVVNPSYSPEQGDFSAGASMSQQIVQDLLSNTAEAAERVGDDDGDFRAELADTLDRLDPGLRIGSWGQLQEWKEDWDDPANEHRHVSHLFSLHPGDQIDPYANPEYVAAAETSLRARGDGGTGWSKAWKINFWARLLDGDHAHRMLSELLKQSTLPNLWDTHPPFQIDGNFGATAGMAEMLVQSHRGVVDVLPALPGDWGTGSVTGLRARGDVTVDVDWADGTPTRIALQAGRSGPLTVRSTLAEGRFRVVDEATGRPVEVRSEGGELTLDAREGHTYVVTTLAEVAVAAPDRVDDGTPFEVEAVVSAGERTVPAATLGLDVPEGWSVTPERHRLRPVHREQSRAVTFEVVPSAGAEQDRHRLRAVLRGDGWQAVGSTTVHIDPLPPCTPPEHGDTLVAWDPEEGETVADASGRGRDARVAGAGGYTGDGPTGSALALDGGTYLASEPTTLGFLEEATFAAEVEVSSSGTYRRLFDSQPSGDPGTDGVLIDLTPSNQVRFIGAGRNVTTDAVVPEARFVDLVVTMSDNGQVTVYVDGERAGSARVPDGGIDGCATRELRFAADQGGGQRLTGAVDRMAVLAEALPASAVGDWQERAFGRV